MSTQHSVLLESRAQVDQGAAPGSDDAADADEPPSIAFRGCDIVTPTGVRLLEALDLTIEAGSNLQICGVDGSGKVRGGLGAPKWY